MTTEQMDQKDAEDSVDTPSRRAEALAVAANILEDRVQTGRPHKIDHDVQLLRRIRQETLAGAKNTAYLITPHGEHVPIPSHIAAQIRSIEYKGGQPVRVVREEDADEPDYPIIGPILNAETLSEAVHLAIGNASTHWESLMGAGVYNEAQARAVSEALLQKIEAVTGFDNESEDKPAYTADELKIVQAEEPVEWRIQRAFANGYREGLERAMRGQLDHS